MDSLFVAHHINHIVFSLQKSFLCFFAFFFSRCDPFSVSKKILILFLSAGLLVLLIGGLIRLTRRLKAQNEGDSETQRFHNVQSPTRSSKHGFYRHAVVTTNNRDCPSVGV